jgi:hypothetical protein
MSALHDNIKFFFFLREQAPVSFKSIYIDACVCTSVLDHVLLHATNRLQYDHANDAARIQLLNGTHLTNVALG